MIDWMIYTKIHELKNNGLRKTQVARRLNINRETVSTYWDMSPGEYAAKEAASKKRKKKADEYKEFVLDCLTKYPDMSAAAFCGPRRPRLRFSTAALRSKTAACNY